uniref:Uncharacterized protein n=1 Tax=Panagrolaimus superbus TaxID=310955 RepID=A0A914YCF6_9BILA
MEEHLFILRRTVRETHKAESFLQKNVKEIKNILRSMIDNNADSIKKLLEEVEERVGRGESTVETTDKLEQLNSKLTNTLKTPDDAMQEFEEVRKEGREARETLRKCLAS